MVEIHQNLRRKIVGRLSEGISAVRIQNGAYLEPFSLVVGCFKAEECLPKHGPLREELEEYVGERPIMDVLSEIVGSELRARNDVLAVDSSGESSLTSHPDFSDSNALAERVVEVLSELPVDYRVVLPLPDKLSQTLHSIGFNFFISDSIGIFTDSSDLDRICPLAPIDHVAKQNMKTGLGLFGLLGKSDLDNGKWDQSGSYIMFSEKGYIDRYGSTETAERFLRNLRGFLGLGIALKIFGFERPGFGPVPQIDITVHRRVGEEYLAYRRFQINERISKGIQRISMLQLSRAVSDDSDRLLAFARPQLNRIAAVLFDPEKNQRLIASGQWLFDSYANEDSLLAYVQAMVSLEIIVGDQVPSSEVSLGETLRNRCAYLVAQSLSEREEILTDFSQIYSVRSQIVHNGKNKLSNQEFRLLEKLRSICGRVLKAEVNLLIEDKLAERRNSDR